MKTTLILTVTIFSLLCFTTYNANADLYLKIGSIKGDVTAQGFQNDIHLSNFQFGVGRSISSITGASERETSAPSLSNLVVGKQMDVSSTGFVNGMFAGNSFPTVDLFLTKIVNGQQFTYNHIVLSNVLISSYSVSSEGDNPTENIGLNYEKIATQYVQQNPDGTTVQTITSCWDFSLQKECTFAVADTIPPTTAATLSGTAGTNGWYVSSVTAALSAIDNSGGSGVKNITYSLDGGPQTAYSVPFTVTGDSNHTLAFNSTDNVGNVEAPKTLYISIDTTPPVITVPSNVTEEATGPQTIVSLGTATAIDTVDGAVTVTNNATATYPVGITMMQYNATDLAGNTATVYQKINITDTTPPTLTLPIQVTGQATGPSGATVTYKANATDVVDGSVTPACTPPSGSTFAYGNTTVTCTATDAHNNKATGTFDVNVQNKIPPTLSISSPANNVIIKTATPTVSGNAIDIVSISKISWKIDTGLVSTVSGIAPGPDVNWSFTPTVSIGIHTIQVNATDSAGLVAISTISITYVSPTVSIPAPTGTGHITFNSDAGGFTSLDSITPASLIPPPPGLYPLGFFSWDITGFTPATSVTVTVTSPVALHHQSHYFKLVGGIWVSVPVTVNKNTMTFVIIDNGPFDGNPTMGIISDPAAVADPTDGRVSGGGSIGKGTNFGFDVQSDLDKTNSIKGNFDYTDRYVKLNLHSNDVSFLSVDPTVSKATMVGTTDYDRHDKHGKQGTNYTFISTISDSDKTGDHDTFSITVTNSTGNVVYQNTGTVKGHIDIHKFFDHDDKSDSGSTHGNNENNNGNDNHGKHSQ